MKGTNNISKDRIQWADTAKGIGMLLVIACHCKIPSWLLYVFIYAFHLPLFFFISGYLFSDKVSFPKFARRKFRTLFIPYIVLAAGILLFDWWEHGKMYAMYETMYFVIQRRHSTLWFLATLFVGIFVFYGIVKLCKKNSVAILITSTVISSIFCVYDIRVGKALPWNVDTAMIIQIFLATGYVGKDFMNKMIGLGKGKRTLLAIGLFLITGVLAGLNLFLSGENLEMYDSSYGIFPLSLLAGLTGSAMVVLIASMLRSKFLSYIGRNSIVIFGWHQAISIILAEKLLRISILPAITQNVWIYWILEIIITVLISLLLNFIVDITPLRRLIKG